MVRRTWQNPVTRAWCLVALGIVLRLWHYLSDPTVWHDEAACILNVLNKGYGELLGPLAFSEAAPPLFLWVEKAASQTLGDGTYALRLVPFLASCLALIVTIAAGRRVLPGPALVWLALLMACSDKLLWHSREAKPYSLDVLAAALLFGLHVASGRWPVGRLLLVATALTPFLVFASYPACFLLGGLTLSILPAVVRARSPRTWLLLALFLAVLAGSFLLLLLGPIHAQRDERILDCWKGVFPDWHRPWGVPLWLVVRSAQVCRYVVDPVGIVLALVTAGGACWLWRHGQRRLVVLLLAPVGLAALAALVRHYPYGGFRVMVFAAPAVLLCVATGLPPLLARLGRLHRLAPLALMLPALLPLGQAAYRVARPWPMPDARTAADFVRAHRSADDVVVGTVWEHEYYFRDLGGHFHYLEAAPGDAAGGVWLLASGNDPAVRSWFLERLKERGTWAVQDQVEFTRLTVYRLVAAPPDGQSERPHSHP
jgi:hypothetical protein